MAPPHGRLPHVVIVGGGFGGPRTPRGRSRERRSGSRSSTGATTTCSSRCSTRWRPPALSPGDIAYPIRRILRRPGERARAAGGGRRRSTSPAASVVPLADGELAYDYLSSPPARRTPTSATTSGQRIAPGLKTIEDALEIRRRVLLAFEAAEREPRPRQRRGSWLTFVVVGGGPTGVELAGALAEIARHRWRGTSAASTRARRG